MNLNCTKPSTDDAAESNFLSMNLGRFILALMVAGFLGTPPAAKAGVLTLTFPEVNGAEHPFEDPFPLPAVDVQTDLFSIPAGNVITSATLSGRFGDTSIYQGTT